MSLTSIINSPKKNLNPKYIPFRDALYNLDISKKKFSGDFHAPLLVPYNCDRAEANLIGCAADWVFRLLIAQKCGEYNFFDSDVLSAIREGDFPDVYNGRRYVSCNQYVESLINLEQIFQDFIGSDNCLSDELLMDCLYIGIEEQWLRSHYEIHESRIKTPLSEKAYLDYKGIVSVFQNNFLNNVSSDANVIFNPIFGDASSCLGGADGDVIIDNSIIDFKCSKNINLQHASHSKQLAGYCILNHAIPVHKINRMCIYSGRTGILHQYVIDATIDSKFRSIANEIIMPLVDKYREDAEKKRALSLRRGMIRRHYDELISSDETVKSLSLKIREWDNQHPEISHNYTSSKNRENLSQLYSIMLSIDNNPLFWEDHKDLFFDNQDGVARCTFQPKVRNGQYVEFKKKLS